MDIILVSDHPSDHTVFRKAVDQSKVRLRLTIAHADEIISSSCSTSPGVRTLVAFDLDLLKKRDFGPLRSLKRSPMAPAPVLVLGDSECPQDIHNVYGERASCYLVRASDEQRQQFKLAECLSFWSASARLPDLDWAHRNRGRSF